MVVTQRPVRLGGFNAQHPYTIDVIAPNGPTLTLLLVPPAAEPSPATVDLPDAPALERWETEGGSVYQRA